MVLQVCADAGAVRDHGDAEVPEEVGVPDAGTLQDPRGVDRSRAADDFTLGTDDLDSAGIRKLDTRRASVLEHDSGNERTRPHREVRARQGGPEVEEPAPAAPAAPGGAIHRREAFLAEAVEIVGPFESGRDTDSMNASNSGLVGAERVTGSGPSPPW